MAHVAALGRAWELLAAAESLVRDDNLTGAAGLAYQAFDLAAKALTQAIDGADPGTHRGRMRRAERLLTKHTEKLDFLWEVRQKDFYGDVTPGGVQELPEPAQVAAALRIVREILQEIDGALHPS